MPPVRVGDANWGVEPGRNVAPGATKISFLGAADQEGVGGDASRPAPTRTPSRVPEQRQLLGTAWKTYELPLAGRPTAAT